MRKIFTLFLLLGSINSFASDLYLCEFSRSNANGKDTQNIKTGWLKADKVKNTLNLQGMDGLQPVAVVTGLGLRVAICDANVCDMSDPVEIGYYAGMGNVRFINGYRHSIECGIY